MKTVKYKLRGSFEGAVTMPRGLWDQFHTPRMRGVVGTLTIQGQDAPVSFDLVEGVAVFTVNAAALTGPALWALNKMLPHVRADLARAARRVTVRVRE